MSAKFLNHLKVIADWPDNFLRAQAPSTHWKVGDWWNDRYFTITCDDPGDKDGHNCKSLGSATGYEVEPSYRKDGEKYPLINFCPPFFEMDNLATRVENLDKGYFDKNDVRSLYSQATAFLHEMMHTSATAAGVSSPRCQDVQVSGYPGKAYGPARAKQLARIELGGPEATAINVDNYVFYAATWYLYQLFYVVPKDPKYSWPRLALDEYYPSDDSTVADDFNSTSSVTGTILDDQDFYDGTNYTPIGGFQPAGPTGLASATELIPMLVTASPTNVPCSTLPPYAQATAAQAGGGIALQPAMCGCGDGSIFAMTSLSGC